MQKGKPIQIRPTIELRKRLEREQQQQQRSLNNMILIILTKFFAAQDQVEAGHGR